MDNLNSSSPASASDDGLLTEEELRQKLKLPHVNAVKWLRRTKKIPHIRLSYRVIRYDLRKVMAALNKLEIKEAGAGRT